MKNSSINEGGNSSKMWIGIILLILGLIFLLNNFNVYIPNWVLDWHTIILAIGLVIGYKSNYKGSGWLMMVIVGALFTMSDILDDYFVQIDNMVWPLAFISLGAYLILKGKDETFIDKNAFKSKNEFEGDFAAETIDPMNSQDYVESVNIFGGSNQRVYSKQFKGGEVVAVFGGCDVDLTQADFEGQVVLDVTAVFGGCKILVPTSWEVKSEISAIFGGVEDKRTLMPISDAPVKRLVLRGVAMFGGVDVRNY